MDKPRALVMGASGGIGQALVHKLNVSHEVLPLSRSNHSFDITDEASISQHLGALTPHFERIVIATGALELNGNLPEKTVNSLTMYAMQQQFALNAIGPALAVKHSLKLVSRNDPAVIAVLSARVGSIGDNKLGGWISYRTAKAALNQAIHTIAIEAARTHPQLTIALLHPGTVATPFTEKYLGRHPSVPPNVAAENLCAVMNRLTPEQSGGFFDYSGKEIAW